MVGKLREPVIRFTHWARAFKVTASADARNERLLRDTSSPNRLGSTLPLPSVFIARVMSRPAHAAQRPPRSLQIANASTVMIFTVLPTIYALGRSPKVNPALPSAFTVDYATEKALATGPRRNHLDPPLTHGTLREEHGTYPPRCAERR